MAQTNPDLIVIGAGSGGIRAARVAAGLGARVTVVECGPLGGTCVNVGCVPKKLLVHASRFSQSFQDAAGFGWSLSPPDFDWTTLIHNKNQAIERLNGIYAGLLDDANVTLVSGRARLQDAHSIAVADQLLRAEHIIIATGSRPFKPDIPGIEHAITSDEAFFLPALPHRIAIVGGGYIGVEFAGIFHGLGVETQLLHRDRLFLRGFDEECRMFLAGQMRNTGMQLHFATAVTGIRRHDDLQLQLEDGTTIDTDQVLFATGRLPNTRDLGLGEAGVKLANNGAICVDDHYTTSVPSIHAIGDVIDRIMLTPMAIAEGTVLAQRLFGNTPARIDYELVPTCIFSRPNLASVGLGEDEARKRKLPIDIYRSDFAPLSNSLSGSNERTLVKLIVAQADDRVLGVHMVGPDAGEIIQGFAVALQAGATKADFDRTAGIHPTAAEEFITLK